MPSRWWIAVAVGGLALSGCAQTQPPSGSGTSATTSANLRYGPAVDGMTALAYRTRLDDAAGGRFQIKLTNTGDEAFTVTSTALDSAGFERLPPAPRTTEFRPGARIDMPTPYGAALCGVSEPAEPAYAALEIVRPDGARETVRVPMPSDYGVLSRIHDEECLRMSLFAALTVELVDLRPIGTGGDRILTGALRLTRRPGTGDVAVTDLRGNVLYDVLPAQGTTLPVANGPEEPALTLPLTIGPATCMTHVLAEIKQPFVYPVWIGVDGAEPVRLEIPVAQPQRDLIYAMLVVACDL